MIRLTALYRHSPGAEFDFTYYTSTHMRLARERLREYGMGLVQVEKGMETLDGQAPGYVCIAHVEFSNLQDLKRGLEAHAEDLMADVPNYTNIEPEVQISEVLEVHEPASAT